jgi:hypothetical protein
VLDRVRPLARVLDRGRVLDRTRAPACAWHIHLNR